MTRFLAMASWLWQVVSTRQGRSWGIIAAACLLWAYFAVQRTADRDDAQPESKRKRGFSAEELLELQNKGAITEEERQRIAEALVKMPSVLTPQRKRSLGLPKMSVVTDLFKRRAIYCPKCGYDLRATPERCPECGTEFRKKRL